MERATYLADEAATLRHARELGDCLRLAPGRALIFLSGSLGAGKTTFCRGILRSLGHEGAVKSPTFTLVEPYEVKGLQIFHFDLYRLTDPNELEYIGFDDYFDRKCVCLVEWPERAADFLPMSDLTVELLVEGAGRRLLIRANSEYGEGIIRQMDGEPDGRD
ncbi:MAG: tRNA (adenosine(37)-N6)-threonylcarbamoyltransferase complex ATPase subunit type 1 TsaE [Pseudomonadales bacterium]